MPITTEQYLNELVDQRNDLAVNLTAMGVEASSTEKFNTLVPKVLQISNIVKATINQRLTISNAKAGTGNGLAEIQSIKGYSELTGPSSTVTGLNASKLRSIGINAWDEDWVRGTYNTSGVLADSTTRIASKNKIPVIPNTEYRIDFPTVSQRVTCLYDEDGVLKRRLTGESNSHTFTTNADEYFATFAFGSNAVPFTEYNNDICFHIRGDQSHDGVYEPHKEITIDLPIITYFPAETYRPSGMHRVGDVYDELTLTQAIKRIGGRRYTSSDDSNPDVITDGTITIYPLTTPVITNISPALDLSYFASEFGTEEFLVDDNVTSSSIMNANIFYSGIEQTRTLNVTENGSFDVTSYGNVNIDVHGGAFNIRQIIDGDTSTLEITDATGGGGGGTVTDTPITITENGTTNTPEGIRYTPITVNVPTSTPTLIQKTVTANGTYTASQDGADGYSKVIVSTPTPTLIQKTVTANGTYTASQDSADGYSKVIVSIPVYNGSVT